MAAECGNPLLLEWLGEWLEVEKTRNTKGVKTYKTAYESMKICPLRFDHPSEAQQLHGLGPKICARLTERMIAFCKENGLPEPKMPKRRKRPLPAAGDVEATTEGDYIPAPKRPRKPKPYVPQLRSGAYAIVIALSTLPDDPSAALSKQQLIELAQEHCDSSFTAPSDPTKFFTAWNSMKTLVEKGIVWERGRPVKRYALSEDGWEVAKRMRNVNDGIGDGTRVQSASRASTVDSGLDAGAEGHWVGVGPSRRWVKPGEEDGEDAYLELGAPQRKTKKTVATKGNRKGTTKSSTFESAGTVDMDPNIGNGFWIGVGPSRRWVEPEDEDYDDLKQTTEASNKPKKSATAKSKGATKGNKGYAMPENANNKTAVGTEGHWEGVGPDRRWVDPGGTGNGLSSRDVGKNSKTSASSKYLDDLLGEPPRKRNDNHFGSPKDSLDDLFNNILGNRRSNQAVESANALGDMLGSISKDNRTSKSDHLSSGRANGTSSKMDRRKENRTAVSSNSLDDTLDAMYTPITSYGWEFPKDRESIVSSGLEKTKENRPIGPGNPLDDLLDPLSSAMIPADFWEPVRSSASKPRMSNADQLLSSSNSLDDLFPSENKIKSPLGSAFTSGGNRLGGVPQNKFSWKKAPEPTVQDMIGAKRVDSDSDDIEILSSPPPRLPAKPSSRSLSRVESESNFPRPHTTVSKRSETEKRTPQPTPQKQQEFTQQLPSFLPIILPPGSFTVRLVLDIREVRTKTDRDYMSAELTKKGVPPVMRSLELGDALWVAKCNDPSFLSKYGEEGDEVMLDWIVERKRLDDLVGSIKDGRFSEQKFRIRRSGVRRVVYIVEEISMSAETVTKWAEAVASAIATIQVVSGWFCKRTAKMDDTIRYLARMTALLKSMYEGKALSVIPSGVITPETYLPLLRGISGDNQGADDDDPDDIKKLKVTFPTFSSLASKSECLTLRDVFLKMLMCIRGISGEKALEIQRVWKTPRELFEAFESCRTTEERERLVEEALKHVVVARRRVGKQVSRRVGEVWGGI